MTVTLDQIAKKAGVSRVTVARALNGTTKQTWASTARRVDHIRRIANDLGYKRHAGAGSIRTNRFGHVGMLTRKDVGITQLNLTKGVAWELAKHDLHLTYCEAELQALANLEDPPKLMREHCVDGLIIHLSCFVPRACINRLEALDLPIVWVNTRADNDCVYPDEFAASERATRRLLELGHKRIAVIKQYANRRSEADVHYSEVDRPAGAAHAMSDAGLQPLLWDPLEGPRDFAQVDAWRARLKAQRPTAVIATDALAARYICFAAMSLGWRIPNDLSIVAYHNYLQAGDEGPSLSTLRLPMIDVGQEAVRMWLEKRERTERKLASRAVPYPSHLSEDTIARPSNRDRTP